MGDPGAATQEAHVVHPMAGLEPDNLLAFLALIGLLRALDAADPDIRPRVVWDGDPVSVSLLLATARTRAEVLGATDAGLRRLGQSYEIIGLCGPGSSEESSHGNSSVTDDAFFAAENYRVLAETWRWDRPRAQLIASLGPARAATRKGGEQVLTSPLRTMYGQGHQHFSSRLKIAATRWNEEAERELERALFEPWHYGDATESFRWDPTEDRRHAYQAEDPSKQKVRTVAGANRLAPFGFGLLTCAPTVSGPGITTLGFRQGPPREMCWPLPGVPTSLGGLLAVLSHPSLVDGDPVPLRAYGVVAIARSGLTRVDKYFSFGRARLEFLR